MSAYSPSAELESKLTIATQKLDIIVTRNWSDYSQRLLNILENYKQSYGWNERAVYILDYLSNHISEAALSCFVYDNFSGTPSNNWIVVNDGVMWGLSKWTLITQNNALVFAGTINTNGGGFSSIRSNVADWLLSQSTSIRLSIKTDSRDYKITLRDQNNRSISHQVSVISKNTWNFEEIIIPLNSLQPTYFGRNITSTAFQKEKARELGFILSDGIDGPFKVEIEKIEFCEG